ncbi:hypothetical protein C8Q80DRAFT_1269742 [Daedaleopsis nitida]|nr:hypothetical protein C8Q80DRAFT_1269742 [Daedaleopsis nitida]
MGDALGNAGMEAWEGPTQPQIQQQAARVPINDFPQPAAAQPAPQPQGQPAAAPQPQQDNNTLRILLESVANIRQAAGLAHQEQVITKQVLEIVTWQLAALNVGACTTTVAASTPSSSGSPRGNVCVCNPRIFNSKAA